jgi:hypothetical protein
MPRAQRHLRPLLLGAMAALVYVSTSDRAVGQAKGESKANPAGATSKAPPTADLVVPSAESTVILIRSTLLSLNDALRTGNYTVLRDLSSPSFREANAAGRLHEIFSKLASQRIDLSAVAILTPKLPQPPAIDQKKRLRISGHFPGEPVQLNFDLTFEAVAKRWQLFGIAVNLAQSATAPSTSAPADEKKLPPQQVEPAR